MRKIVPMIFIIPIIVLLSAAGVQAKSTSTPPGSFVSHRVVSLAQLVQQVRKDSVVRVRYAKHFGIAPQAVADYFSNLRLVSLKRPLRATVWYVGKKGLIHTKTKLLPKGTAVFADRMGRPVIVWSCGNPLVKKLIKPNVEKVSAKAPPQATVDKAPVREVLAPPVEATPPTTIEELVKAAPIETVGAPPVDILPELSPEMPAAALEEFPTISIGGGSSPFLSAALVLTGSVPVVGSLTSGGGSRRGGGGGGDVDVVPEPATLVGFGIPMIMVGIGSLKPLRRRR